MPHLMNCHHPEESWAWCLSCVKAQYDELEQERIEAGKYSRCLEAAAQRLQEAYSLRDVKAVGLMEVPTVIDELIGEVQALRSALKSARLGSKLRGITTRDFAAMCAVSPSQLSKWTAEPVPKTDPVL